MSDAGGQQAKRSELFGLNHLFLKPNSLGNVVYQDQPAYPVSGFSNQWSDRDVDYQVSSGTVPHAEFIQAGDVVMARASVDFRHKVSRQDIFQLAADGFV